MKPPKSERTASTTRGTRIQLGDSLMWDWTSLGDRFSPRKVRK
jgi:hypothetical protein